MVNPTDTSQLGSVITSAATIVALQKWLKTRDAYTKIVAAFPGSDRWAHWTIAAVSSVIAAAGIHVVWNWDMIHGGQATAIIPDLPTMLHGIGDWFKVYILQHTIYEATHEPPYVPPSTVQNVKP